MRVIDLKTFSEVPITSIGKISCCVGNFDGLHIGHKALIDETIMHKGNNKSAIWTFEVNPKLIMHKDEYLLLSTNEQKIKLLSQFGLDYAIFENYTSVYNLSKEDFVNKTLIKECNVIYGVCGYNFKFGYKAEGNSNDFAYLFNKMNIGTTIIPQVTMDGIPISSSTIRSLIEEGNIKIANKMLGHPYSLASYIIKGNEIGRTINFPTINQSIPKNQVIPKFGVYKSNVIIDGYKYSGITNVGTKPTIDEQNQQITIETHIFDFSKDVYSKFAIVELLDFLRPEKRFENLDELKKQIAIDIECAKN